MALPPGVARPADLGREVNVQELEVGREYYVWNFTRPREVSKARIERINRNNAGAPQSVILEPIGLGVLGVGMDQIGARNNEEYERRLPTLFRFYTVANDGKRNREENNFNMNHDQKRAKLNARRRKSRKTQRKTRRNK